MSMKKRILIMAAGLLVLVGAVVAVMIMNKQKEANAPESSSSEILYENLWTVNKDDIREITLVTKADTITLIPGERTVDGTLKWVLKDHENWSLVNTYQNLVSMSVQFDVYKLIEEKVTDQGRLSEFGLTEPNAHLYVQMADGSTKEAIIGIGSSDKKYAFCQMVGDDNVYACNYVYAEYGSLTRNSIRLPIITELAPAGNYDVYSVFVQQKGERPVRIEYDEIAAERAKLAAQSGFNATYLRFREPYSNDYLEVRIDINSGWYKELKTPEMYQVIDADCQDLDKYGLGDEPEYRETITTRAQSTSGYDYYTTDYLFGYTYESGEYIYFREGDSNMVMGVHISCMENRHFEPFYFVNKLIYLNPIGNVESGSFTYKGETHEFTVQREETDPDSSLTQDEILTVFRMDGHLVETDAFTRLYRAILEISPEYEILGEAPVYDESDMLEFTFHNADGRVDHLKFYRLSEFYYVTQIDENIWFACAAAKFDAIAQRVEEAIAAQIIE